MANQPSHIFQTTDDPVSIHPPGAASLPLAYHQAEGSRHPFGQKEEDTVDAVPIQPQPCKVDMRQLSGDMQCLHMSEKKGKVSRDHYDAIIIHAPEDTDYASKILESIKCLDIGIGEIPKVLLYHLAFPLVQDQVSDLLEEILKSTTLIMPLMTQNLENTKIEKETVFALFLNFLKNHEDRKNCFIPLKPKKDNLAQKACMFDHYRGIHCEKILQKEKYETIKVTEKIKAHLPQRRLREQKELAQEQYRSEGIEAMQPIRIHDQPSNAGDYNEGMITISGKDVIDGSLSASSSTASLHKASGDTKQDGGVIQSALDLLESMLKGIVGLEQIKDQLRSFVKKAAMEKLKLVQSKEAATTKVFDAKPHMVFCGNPGTGKSSVADIIGKVLCSIKLVNSPDVQKVQKGHLVADHLGGTEKQTMAVIEKARGQVLLVDEAYQLTPQAGGRDFGRDVVERFMEEMSEAQSQKVDTPVFIFAGYKDEMMRFCQCNDGLRRRIQYTFHFPNYTIPELVEILFNEAKRKNYHLQVCKEDLISLTEKNISEEDLEMHNAGFSTRLLDRAKAKALVREADELVKCGGQANKMTVICLEDFQSGIEQIKQDFLIK